MSNNYVLCPLCKRNIISLHDECEWYDMCSDCEKSLNYDFSRLVDKQFLKLFRSQKKEAANG